MGKYPHSLIDFPKSRLATIDLGRIGRTKHHIAALLEIDVTEARKRLHALRRQSDQPVSFTSWLVKTLCTAIMEHKEVHALMSGRRRKLIVFDDINFAVIVEKEVDGKKVPLPLLLEQANRKSIAQIHEEIAAAKTTKVSVEKDYVLSGNVAELPMKIYYLLPPSIRCFIMNLILSRPFLRNQLMGTVLMSSVANISRFSGWFIHKSYHNLSFGIGSVVKKPWAVQDEIKIRDVLHMTLLMDHDVVDGAPMARFVSRMSDLLEKAHGLPEPTPSD